MLRTYLGPTAASRGGALAVRKLVLEVLEGRRLLSVAPAELPAMLTANSPTSHINAIVFAASSGVVGHTPVQIQTAYGLNQLPANGAGQTVAIVDAYDDPAMLNSTDPNFATSDLAKFDTQFGLPNPPSFIKVNQSGSTSNLPGTDPAGAGNHTWEIEESLDVEWVHAIAPMANIVLVEANSNSNSSLYTAVATAANMSGVSVVSMSWGADEFSSETSEDPVFSSAPKGVTFLASTGDSGSPGEYPAYSPYVVAVGGTQLTLNANNSYNNEVGWSGTGGGQSQFETEPSFQTAVQSTGVRTTPDISFDASPSSGVAVYDSWDYGTTPWADIGGTSLAAPSWAGLIALTNQLRASAGLGTLTGSTQTLPTLYALPSSDFHDVTSGSNGAFSAGPGYDEVTGLGTPIANLLVPDLAGLSGPATQLLVTSEPAGKVTVGAGFNLVVRAENSYGLLDPTYNGSVTVSLANNPGSSALGGTVTVSAVNGIATFSGLTVSNVGSAYTLQVSANGLTSGVTTPFNVTARGVATHLVFSTQPPTSATAGATFSLTASAEDDFGTVDTTDNGSISLALGNNTTGATLSGTLTLNATNGATHFTGLSITRVGSGYTLVASSSGLTTGTSRALSITPATASQEVLSVPTNVLAGTSFTATATAEDRFGNVVTSFHNNVTIALSANPGGSTLSGTLTVAASSGVATFSGLTLNRLGTGYTMRATTSGLPAATSAAFTVIPGATTQFVITSQPPSSIVAGDQFSVVVIAYDSLGNINTNDQSSIFLALADNPESATLVGPSTVSLVNGVATVAGLTIDTAGTGYTLGSGNLSTFTVSNPITVVAGPASQLVVTTDVPSSVAAGGAFGVVVTAEDQYGNVDPTFGQSVSIALANNPGGGTLGGTLTATASSGIATFSNLSLTASGDGYMLEATDNGLSSAFSSAFDVTPLSATQLVVTTQPPASVAAGGAFGVVVTAEDQYGNVDPTFGQSVSVALANNPGGGTLGGTLTATASSGVATFSGLSLTKAANGYTLQATSSGVTSITTSSFNVTPLSATHLSVSTQPPSSVNSEAAFSVGIDALDQYNNVATIFGNVTLAISTNPATGTLGGTTTVAFSGSVASFSNLTLDNTGNGYVLQASAGGLPSITTSAINVLNVPPVAGISGPTSSLRGQTQSFTLTASDSPADMTAGFNFNINWGDGSPIQLFTGPSGSIVTHAFNANSTISVTATDQGGAISAPATQNITVSSVELLPDANNPLLTDLVWSGTTGADHVQFTQVGPNSVTITESQLNGVAVNNVNTYTGITGRVIGYGQDGNDTVDGSGLQTIPATLDGGGGSNTIFGGQAGDILIGGFDGGEGQPGGNVIVAGNGNNTIYGDSQVGAEGSTGGNNLIIGGTGNDTIYGTFQSVVNSKGQPSTGGEGGQNLIVGNGGSDTIYASQQQNGGEGGHGSILIAGSTSLNESALQSVLNEWKSSDTQAVKIASLTGTPSGQDLNGTNYLIPGTTVSDNGAIADTIYSDTNGKVNWLFYDFNTDTANRVKPSDVTTNLN